MRVKRRKPVIEIEEGQQTGEELASTNSSALYSPGDTAASRLVS